MEEYKISHARIAVIGGSGLYDMENLVDVQQVDVDTPFGSPSDVITVGTLGRERVAFLPRHGRGHRLSPTEIPVRANIYALKTLGVGTIISVSAVGSLKEELRPLDLLVPDQLIDRTRQRSNTFFGDGIVAHISFAAPFCPKLSQMIYNSALGSEANVHFGGTYVVMEGPSFSTKAESHLYRSWGADVIGMTAVPEAKLARDAEICYATLACVTDYDCWRDSDDIVTVEMVVTNLLKNTDVSQGVVCNVVSRMPEQWDCICNSALEDAIITSKDRIPTEVKDRLSPIIGTYCS